MSGRFRLAKARNRMKFDRVNQYLQTGANVGVILVAAFVAPIDGLLERECDP